MNDPEVCDDTTRSQSTATPHASDAGVRVRQSTSGTTAAGYTPTADNRLFFHSTATASQNLFLGLYERVSEDDCVCVEDPSTQSIATAGKCSAASNQRASQGTQHGSLGATRNAQPAQSVQGSDDPYSSGCAVTGTQLPSFQDSPIKYACMSSSEPSLRKSTPAPQHHTSSAIIHDRERCINTVRLSLNEVALTVEATGNSALCTEDAHEDAFNHSILTCTADEFPCIASFVPLNESGSLHPNSGDLSSTQRQGELGAMHLDFGIYGDVLAGGWPGDRRNWPYRNASDRSKNPYLSQENILIFLIFGLVLSPAIQFFFLAFCNFHDHNVRFCNEKARCPCEFSEAARFVFTYGLHMYIPYAVFNPMLFFLALHVITQEREQQRLLCRIRCYITTDNIGQTNAEDAAGQHRALWWDVPPVVQALYSNFPFWTTVVMRFVLLATLETWVIKLPGEDAKRAILLTLALSVPLLVTARYTGELSLIVPFVLLDAYPLLIPSIIASTGVGKEMRHALHPLLLGLVERLFWYLSAAAMPQGTPVGIKVAVSSTFAFVYVVSALISTMFIAGKQWLLVLVISAAQIFLFEMLFNLLVVEVLVLQFFRCIVTRIKHGEPSPVAIEVTDPINISTQVRWPAMLLAVCAALPLFFVTRWDRVLPRGQCDGYVPRREHSLLAPLVSCAAAFAMACVLAAVIRLRYDRLRPPLVVHDWFLTLMWGWFIVCSVPFALTAAF